MAAKFDRGLSHIEIRDYTLKDLIPKVNSKRVHMKIDGKISLHNALFLKTYILGYQANTKFSFDILNPYVSSKGISNFFLLLNTVNSINAEIAALDIA